MDQDGLYKHWKNICAKQEDDFRVNALNKLVIRVLSKNDVVLDVGCGACGLTLYLLEKGFNVISIDTSDEMLSMGRALLSKHNVSSDSLHNVTISEFSAKNQNSFKQIVCLDVIEHIEDDAKAISALTSMLRIGGHLVITVPAVPSLYGPKDVAVGHYRRYNKRMIEKLFNSSSCNIKTMRYWNFIGFPVTWFHLYILKRPVNESMRGENIRFDHRCLSVFLRFWFSKFENRIIPPVGLTLLIIVEKK